MQLAIIIGLGVAAWYAWGHHDVKWENPMTMEQFMDLYNRGLLPPEFYE